MSVNDKRGVKEQQGILKTLRKKGEGERLVANKRLEDGERANNKSFIANLNSGLTRH